MTSREEQETHVSAPKVGGVTYFYTTDPVHLRKLRKDPRVTERSGGEDWGNFAIPSDQYDPLKGFKRAPRRLTDEQRAAAADRLAAARAQRGK